MQVLHECRIFFFFFFFFNISFSKRQQASFLSPGLSKETVEQSIKHHPYQGGSLLDINVNFSVVNGDEFILRNMKYIHNFYHFSTWNFWLWK